MTDSLNYTKLIEHYETHPNNVLMDEFKSQRFHYESDVLFWTSDQLRALESFVFDFLAYAEWPPEHLWLRDTKPQAIRSPHGFHTVNGMFDETKNKWIPQRHEQVFRHTESERMLISLNDVPFFQWEAMLPVGGRILPFTLCMHASEQKAGLYTDVRVISPKEYEPVTPRAHARSLREFNYTLFCEPRHTHKLFSYILKKMATLHGDPKGTGALPTYESAEEALKSLYYEATFRSFAEAE